MTPAERMLLWQAENSLADVLKALARVRRSADASEAKTLEELGVAELSKDVAATMTKVCKIKDDLRAGLQSSDTPPFTPAKVVRLPNGEAA